MLDHVEIVFENMKPMMKKLKKKNYKSNMEDFLGRYGHYFQEMTILTENADDKEAAGFRSDRKAEEGVSGCGLYAGL